MPTKKQMTEIVQESGRYHEQHHPIPQNVTSLLNQKGHNIKAPDVVLIPKDVHKLKRIHQNNRNIELETLTPRRGVAQGLWDTRAGLQEAGYEQDEINEMIKTVLKLTKERNVGAFDKITQPK